MNAPTAPLSAARARRGLLVLLPVLVLLTLSCQLVAGPAAVASTPAVTRAVVTTAPPAAASSPAAPADLTATSLPTVTPARTETEWPTVTAAPQPALNLEGPWLLVSASSGLWSANPDGSALTHLTDAHILGPHLMARAVSPDGHTLAYITGDEDGRGNLALNLLTLPDGQSTLITPLTGPLSQPGPDDLPGGGPVEAVRAMTDLDSLAWSPDGKTLAFIGAMDGPSADLYTYNLANRKITQLTDGPSQAYEPNWSPDGKYIVHFGVETFGTGAGFSMTGAWAARVHGQGQAVLDLYTPTSSGEKLVGWVDATHFVVYGWTPACGPRDLRIIDLAGGAPKTLLEGCFSGAAMTPFGDLLITGQQGSALRGVHYLDLEAPASWKQVASEDAGGVALLPGSPEFLVFTPGGQAVYSTNGERMAVSPAAGCAAGFDVAGYGLIYAWTCKEGDPGVWINGPGLEEKQVFSEPAGQPIFAFDNRLLFFSQGRLLSAPFLDYTPQEMSQITGEVRNVAWVGAD